MNNPTNSGPTGLLAAAAATLGVDGNENGLNSTANEDSNSTSIDANNVTVTETSTGVDRPSDAPPSDALAQQAQALLTMRMLEAQTPNYHQLLMMNALLSMPNNSNNGFLNPLAGSSSLGMPGLMGGGGLSLLGRINGFGPIGGDGLGPLSTMGGGGAFSTNGLFLSGGMMGQQAQQPFIGAHSTTNGDSAIPNSNAAVSMTPLVTATNGDNKAKKRPSSSSMEDDGKLGRNTHFPLKLHQLLLELKRLGKEDIACFAPHGRSFAILKPQAFVEEILPKYFRMSRFASFQRQLNLWCFHRISEGSEKGSYYHTLFLQDQPDLCSQMKRVKNKGLATRAKKMHSNSNNQVQLGAISTVADTE